jgi:pyruvate,orthophosphate dikinase
VGNVFSNIGDVSVALNNALQGKFTTAYSDLGRVAINSTLGARSLRYSVNGRCAVLCTATSAGAGLAVGSIALDPDRARELAAQGPVILVRRDATAFDIAGLAHAQGLLTARGGRASHAAVAARELDKVVLVGCPELDIDLATRTCRIGETLLEEGAPICLDGNTGRVLSGRPELTVDRPEADIAEMERWRKLSNRTAARSKARAS